MIVQTGGLARRIVPFLIIAVVIVLLVLGFRPTPLLVDGEPVVKGHLALTVEGEGRTRVIDRYEISAPVAAHARRIQLDVGDPVAAGDLLVVLDALSTPALDVRAVHAARARVAAAEAVLAAAREDVKAAEAVARFAKNEADRLSRLAEQGMTTRSLMEQTQAEARRTQAAEVSARFRVRTAEYDLAAARTALAYAGGRDPGASGVIELRAPVAGRVLKRSFESSRVVQAGEAILEIGDPLRLEVEVDLLSADAVRVAAGMRVLLERWGDPDPLEGKVRRVEPTAFTKISALGVEEQRVWVIADITSPPERWSRLGHGYRVNARFVLWEAPDVLRVPTSSLFRQGQEWAVFVVRNGNAVLRRVEIGRRGGLYTEALKGLAEGETVIVHPDRDVTDGRRVRLRQ